MIPTSMPTSRIQKLATMSEPSPITEYRLTDHAQLEMRRRHISEANIAQVLAAPDQAQAVRPGRVVYQSRAKFGEPAQTYLLRVFVDLDRRPAEVVTAYRTSKIEKYWREGS